MQTIETQVFTYNELSDEAKEKARDWFRNVTAGDDMYVESVFSDAEEIAKLIGIEFNRRRGSRCEPAIWFSGFSSQGDGACFEGAYSYAKGGAKAVRDYAPKDETLHRIAEGLQAVQKRNFYQLRAETKQSGHYMHSGCMRVSVSRNDDKEVTCNDDDTVRDLLRSFADWIYRRLEQAYDWENSDENVAEAIEANEYTFTADGKRFG